MRKIDLMHHLFGKTFGEICGKCKNFICERHHNRTYKKCSIYGETRSEASDWRVSYLACGLFPDKEPGMDRPVIKLVSPDREEVQIPGQMTIDDFMKEAKDGDSEERGTEDKGRTDHR